MNYLGFQAHAIDGVLRLGVLNQQRVVVLLQEGGREREMKKCGGRKGRKMRRRGWGVGDVKKPIE